MKKYIRFIILFSILITLVFCIHSFSTNNNDMIFRETLPEGYVPTKTQEELSAEYDELLKQHANNQEERDELWQKEYELKQEMIDLVNYYKSINYQKDITYDNVKQAIISRQAAYSVLVDIGKETNNIECIENMKICHKLFL